MISFDIKKQLVLWDEPVPDTFSALVKPIIINNMVYLVSNKFSGDLESTIYGYNASTGINQFIKEFPKTDKGVVALDIIEKYNSIIEEKVAILVLIGKKHYKELSLLNVENGNPIWTTQLNSFPVLDGLNINSWNRDGKTDIVLVGDQDYYTINIASGDILSEKRFEQRFTLRAWGNNILEILNKEISLWSPVGKKKWAYTSDSNNSICVVQNNLAIVGSDNGILRAFNVDGGWFNWNSLRWLSNTYSKTFRLWSHSMRVFCLTGQDSLFTFDILSGEKINSIRLDRNNYYRYTKSLENEVMVLANEEFILGIDPLNGDQLWKIKEPRVKNRQIRPLDNNLFVIKPIVEDSIITINNYNRNNGNLMWNETLSRHDLMDKQKINLSNMGWSALSQSGSLHPSLYSYFTTINGFPYLITENSIKEINISSDVESVSIEPRIIKLQLARAHYGANNIPSAISEYSDLVKFYDQMNKDGHRELTDIYKKSGMNNEAIDAMLNYYNLLLPNSKEAHATINELKEATPLKWVHNIYIEDDDHWFSSNFKFLLSDNNKIYQLSKNKVEIYRTNTGALLQSIDLDKNIFEIMHASAEDKNVIILIVRLELEEIPVWGKDKWDMSTWKHEKTQYNLMKINKSSGLIELNTSIQTPPDHNISELSLNQDNILINSILNEKLTVENYNISNGQQKWIREFKVSSYYHLNNNLQNLFYNDQVLLVIDDRVVFLDSKTGKTKNEFIADDIEDIIVFNNMGLVDDRLTFIVEDIDYEYITLDLKNIAVLYRDIWDSESPNISAKVNDCLIEITLMGVISSYCFVGDVGAIEKTWSIDLSWVPNYIGKFNDNLIFIDQTNDRIVELESDRGKEKNDFPIIWKSDVFDLKNNNVILQTDRRLFVFNL